MAGKSRAKKPYRENRITLIRIPLQEDTQKNEKTHWKSM